MPAQNIDLGTGATLVGGTSGWSMQITSLSITGIARESVNSSHLGTTTAHTFIPGDLYDPGTFVLEGHGSAGDVNPTTLAAETWTLTLPDTSTIAASGFFTDYEITNIAVDQKITFSGTIKLSGAITINEVA